MFRPLRWCLVVFLVCKTVAVSAEEWVPYTAPDQSFSFHQPAGWTVVPHEEYVEIINNLSGEYMVLVAMTVDPAHTPQQIGLTIFEALGESLPELQIHHWRDTEEDAEQVALAHLTYTIEGRLFQGDALIVKEGDQGLWLSYAAPREHYVEARVGRLLRGILMSLADGPVSPHPDVELFDLVFEKAVRNAQAFVFLLEFASGAPFTAAQEELIVSELVNSWEGADLEHISAFDGYADLRILVMHLEQDQYEEIRQLMENTVREVLQEIEDDPAVAVIRTQFDKNGAVLIEGDPPLREVAAQSFAELFAYTHLLAQDAEGEIEDIDPQVVTAMRQALLASWPEMSAEDRTRVTDMPGVWTVIRTVMRSGEFTDRETVRRQLRELVPVAAQAAVTPEGEADENLTRTLAGNYIRHQTLMMMQQWTFNTYMWSRGFQGWTPMGKMW